MNIAQNAPAENAPLERVINTDQLKQRPARIPDHAAEARAFVRLAKVMAHSPQHILQTMTDEALELCRAGTAGISIIEDQGSEKVFRWHALSGALSSHLWGTTPRDFSPCGTVVDRNSIIMMSHLEQHFTYFADVRPEIVEALLVPFTVNGRAVGTVWVVMHDDTRKFDLEDRRLLEDLGNFAAAAYSLRTALDERQESDRRKDEFLATLAHELRNPLAPIRMAAHILDSPTLAQPKLQWAQKVIQRQVGYMALLLDDLLDIARISQGKLVLRRERVGLADVVDSAVEAARSLLDKKNHSLVVSLPTGAVTLDGDHLRLSQILSNLLNNAAKYTDPAGHIELLGRVDGGTLLLTVRDDGIGISAEFLAQIFRMFSQVDGSSIRGDGGLGIGLALVSGLVELHGGRIEAKSKGLGHGSEFIVALPMTSLNKIELSEQESDRPSIVARGRRVLVTDDNKDAADALAAVLEIVGHEVRVAYGGRAALLLAQTFRPDVALLDVGMPDLNGYEVAIKVRRELWGAGIFLIALTGYGRVEDRQRAREAGFDQHLTKPIDPDSLEKLIAGSVAPSALSPNRHTERRSESARS